MQGPVAEYFLRYGALPVLDEDIILNLVGFSRGGITAMRFANRVMDQEDLSARIEKINILAFDPVAGDTSLSPSEFVLNDKVSQYVGVYSTDERAAMFSPAIPELESYGTTVWNFRVPGAHETMVGNPETDGHSTNLNLACWFLKECTDSELLQVSWVTTFIAEGLLGSSQWGGLAFDMEQLDDWHSGLEDDNSEDLFVGKVDTLWDYNYSGMRNFSANILLGFESCQWDEGTSTLTYGYYAFADWFVFGGFNHERCTDWFHYDYGSTDPQAVWQRQLIETGPFMPVAPLDNGETALAMLRLLGNSGPVVDAGGPYEGHEGTALAFDAGGSVDPDGDPLVYRWDFDGDGVWDTDWNDSPAAEHTFGDDHSGTVLVEVNDGDLTSTASAAVTIANVAPEAAIDSVDRANPFFILPGIHTLAFNGIFSDAGWLDSHTSAWDFGDGVSLPGDLTEENEPPEATGSTSAQHVYSEAGAYTVSLEVVDDDGGIVTVTTTVTVATARGACSILDDYVQGLPNEAFKNNAEERKGAFSNKMAVIDRMVAAGKYHPTVTKLLHEVRPKGGGETGGDWITDPSAQADICMMIDDLVEYLSQEM